MNHELAKDLKEAGFQQAGDGATYVDLGSKDSFYVPTLEELLEACVQLVKPKEPTPSELHFFELYPNMNIATSGGSREIGDSMNGVQGGLAEPRSTISERGTTISARLLTKPWLACGWPSIRRSR